MTWKRSSILSAVGLGVVIGWGCAAGTRDRLEQFFFEVPVENDDAAVVAEKPQSESWERPTATPPEPKYVSVHPPYAKRACTNCHDSSGHVKEPASLAQACGSCHTRYFGDEVGHAPVADGECDTCHQLHRSEQPALLRQTLLQTCVDCHDAPSELSQPAHAGEQARRCTQCHDPHFGVGKLLKAEQ